MVRPLQAQKWILFIIFLLRFGRSDPPLSFLLRTVFCVVVNIYFKNCIAGIMFGSSVCGGDKWRLLCSHSHPDTHTHLFLILDPKADIRSEVVAQLKMSEPKHPPTQSNLSAVSSVCTPGIQLFTIKAASHHILSALRYKHAMFNQHFNQPLRIKAALQ